MEFNIKSHTENYCDVIDYLKYGTVVVPEYITLEQNAFLYDVSFDFEISKYYGKLCDKKIYIEYDKKLKVDKSLNDKICKYVSEKYDCQNTSTSFIDSTIKIKFLGITKDYKLTLDDVTDGSCDSDECVYVIIDGKSSIIYFNFTCDKDWSNGINNQNIHIKYKYKVDIDIDKQIQEFIMESDEEYEKALWQTKYPYYYSNLLSFDNTKTKKITKK
jgi:hypothetical protein